MVVPSLDTWSYMLYGNRNKSHHITDVMAHTLERKKLKGSTGKAKY